MAQLEADTCTRREKANRSRTDVECHRIVIHRVNGPEIGDIRVRESQSANDVRPQRVLADAEGHGNDDVSCCGQEVAAQDDVERIVALEEVRRVREFAVEAEDARAQPANGSSKDDVRRTLALLKAGTSKERGLTSERAADKRRDEVLGQGLAGATAQGDQQQSRDPRCARGQVQGTKVRRKVLAKMDVVTSPASSANGAVNPSLLARRISVSRRLGTFTISDEYASSTTPNCQASGSPL